MTPNKNVKNSYCVNAHAFVNHYSENRLHVILMVRLDYSLELGNTE